MTDPLEEYLNAEKTAQKKYCASAAVRHFLAGCNEAPPAPQRLNTPLQALLLLEGISLGPERSLIFAVALLALAVMPVGLVTAQTSLIPNQPRSFETLWGGFMGSYYNNYTAGLTAGHWTVIVTILVGLQVNITVASDAAFTNVIAVSGQGSGNYPSVAFTLSGSQTVYIRVAENSVYHDSFGSYNIGVYDDVNNPIYRMTALVVGIIAAIVIIVVVVVVVVVLLHRRGRESA
jgi:hypothetical protein